MKTLRVVSCICLLAAIAGGSSVIPAATPLAELPMSQRAANAAIARWPDGRFAPAGAPQPGTTSSARCSKAWTPSGSTPPIRATSTTSRAQSTRSSPLTVPSPRSSPKSISSTTSSSAASFSSSTASRRTSAISPPPPFSTNQLAQQPRNAEGGFWHKQRYPNQMWLDGLYMAEPFRAEYASISHHPEEFADITQQFVLMEQHARDPKTGLLYHGWDASKQERWANKQTGDSSAILGARHGLVHDGPRRYARLLSRRRPRPRATYRHSPARSRRRRALPGSEHRPLVRRDEQARRERELLRILLRLHVRLRARQGRAPRLSARQPYLAIAAARLQGHPHALRSRPDGDDVSLTDTVKASGLGGEPYRDGSYAYYIGEKVVTNDPKGVGAFLLASTEMEYAPESKLGRGDTVVVDGWFNSQQRTDAFGQQVYFHYKWNTWDEPGYSLFGHLFREFGAQTSELDAEPTLANLKGAQVYIIASPDNVDKNPHPHFANAEDADADRRLGQRRRRARDHGERHLLRRPRPLQRHLRQIRHPLQQRAAQARRRHQLGAGKNRHRRQRPHLPPSRTPSTSKMSAPSPSAARLMPCSPKATTSSWPPRNTGREPSIAMVDPWLYNEYTDGRKLPAIYDNYAAGKEFVRWILEQVPQH